MQNTSLFDVLVVYNNSIATSASSTNLVTNKPFSQESNRAHYNDAYAYLLETCANNNIKAAFTTSSDIVGPGTCKSYWIFKKNKWEKNVNYCYSKLIFDKFLPTTNESRIKRDVVFSNSNIKAFTNKYLLSLFFDKFATYFRLPGFSIPTELIKDNKKKSIKKPLSELRKKVLKMDRNADFSNKIILKDRYGAGGFNIFKIESNFVQNIQNLMKKNKGISFIIQPYVNFKKGYRYKNYVGATEIRLIYLNQKLVQTYIRVASNADFLCNHGKGGIQISVKDVPKNVLERAKKIAGSLNEKVALFALDFIVSDQGNVYLLEGNISPGIEWHEKFPKNKMMNKKMIRVIVNELSNRINQRVSIETIEKNPTLIQSPIELTSVKALQP